LRQLVLAGAGHSHALVLRELALAPLAGVEVRVVSPQARAPYSGMVPGWLAGHYAFDDIVVDFPRLCAAAGARWVEGEIDAIDPARRRLRLADGEELPYDALSLNVGSTLRPPPTSHALMLPLRPLAELRARYESLLARLAEERRDDPLVVTSVGGGAAGFEALLGVLAQLRATLDRPVLGSWVSRGTELLPGFSAPARRAALRALRRADVTVQLGTAWCEVKDQGSDLVLWATGAEAHDWQRDTARRGALAVDEQGFIRIDEHLRSVSHAQIFAAGDCASWASPALPKAGVYAVRMGLVLANNLRAALGAPAPLQAFRPQHRFLALLATGDGRAIASRGPFGAEGRWAWRWKDRIDRRFLAQFQGLSPRPEGPAPALRKAATTTTRSTGGSA
jgi:pyridine nucleotide-disulfide oxidoreductase family protein